LRANSNIVLARMRVNVHVVALQVYYLIQL